MVFELEPTGRFELRPAVYENPDRPPLNTAKSSYGQIIEVEINFVY